MIVSKILIKFNSLNPNLEIITREETKVSKKSNKLKEGPDGLGQPSYPRFESKKLQDAFDESFALRILYKPKEGVLWGYHDFWVPKNKFYAPPPPAKNRQDLDNFSLLHTHSVAENLNMSL